ncbi:hypothetical protein BDV30DRAFT_210309 [Aspergillus minisclerotigenes]|uniref:Secreted protein n=1 Tax=Aspergillus minisclerotigenes TaxID=656917 RepID=A0A5N6J623_9EURO|nr:hypothetical protein BDV30DRAFT_210309 [Aspergillus minisclerotigenes]
MSTLCALMTRFSHFRLAPPLGLVYFSFLGILATTGDHSPTYPQGCVKCTRVGGQSATHSGFDNRRIQLPGGRLRGS